MMEINKPKLTSRYASHKKRAKDLGFEPAPKEVYQKILEESNGFCYYCDVKLQWFADYPHLEVPSFDHKKPLTSGGKDEYENICLCCHSCNIIKGTMTAPTFKEVVKAIKQYNPLLLKVWFEEAFRARLADKIERNENIEKQVKKQ